MRRDALRKICQELFDSQHTRPDDFALRAGKGIALSILLPEVLDEMERLEAAIRKHRDQKGDDRCWMDDQDLYAALGAESIHADTSLPPREEFMESCRRFYAQRQAPHDGIGRHDCMTIAQLEAEVERLKAENESWCRIVDGYREVCQEHLRQIEIYRTTRDEVRDEVHRLEAERDAFRRAVERTERGQTKPYRLGRLAELLCDLLATDYAGRSADPRSMTMVLRDVADLYRGLVLACDPGNDGVYFPGLPPLGDDEGWPLMGLGVAGNAADEERKSG
jgi:hypothetical protein